MRDPDRMESILKMLLEYWKMRGNSDQRLGQLLINLMRDADHPGTDDAGPELFELEDDALFDLLDGLLDTDPSKAPSGPVRAPRTGPSMHTSGISMSTSPATSAAIKRALASPGYARRRGVR